MSDTATFTDDQLLSNGDVGMILQALGAYYGKNNPLYKDYLPKLINKLDLLTQSSD